MFYADVGATLTWSIRPDHLVSDLLSPIGRVKILLHVSPGAGVSVSEASQLAKLGPTSAHTFVSVRAGTTFSDLSVELFIDNVLDSHSITSITPTTLDGTGPQPPVSPMYTYTTFRRRTFGLSFIYRNQEAQGQRRPTCATDSTKSCSRFVIVIQEAARL
jgi:hypothetical protein